MATQPEPFKLQQKPLMRVYEGKRPYRRAAGDDYGFGPVSGGEEKFYHDELGNEVTGFDPKTHQVVGTLGEGNRRIRGDQGIVNQPFAGPRLSPAYSGPMARRPEPTDGAIIYRGNQNKPLNLGGIMSGASQPAATAAPAAPTNPADAVRAQAAGPAPQLSIAEQQREDIRKRGGMTAEDFDRENVAHGNRIYKERYGDDITTVSGRLSAKEKALERIRPRALTGSGVREITNPDGSVSGVSTLPDALIPGTSVTNRERALGRHFATPQAGTNGTPFVSGGNWTGNNPVTGEFKDPEGNIWPDEATFRRSQKGDVETDGPPAGMNTNEPVFSWNKPDYIPAVGSPDHYKRGNHNAYPKTDLPNPTNNLDFGPLRKAMGEFQTNERLKSGRAPVRYDNGLTGYQPVEPTMSTEDYVRQGINMEEENKNSKVPASWNNWNEKTGGNVNGVRMSPSDSEPQAGGNYGTPKLIDTWTPQNGGRSNGVNRSRADSEPEGDYGIPELIRSRTRPMQQPSRASLLRAKPNYDTRGYNGQM